MPDGDTIRGARILLAGGTGSFGRAFLPQLLALGPARVVVFSRDEAKHAALREEFPGTICEIGDVRDFERVREVLRRQSPDVVLMLAALKRVDDCESHPAEAVQTNVVGALNVLRAAADFRIPRLVAVSTDKAVEPINTMGMTKAIQERLVRAYGYNVARYGNVIGSRGSVIPLFHAQAKAGRPLRVTDPEMTRFWLPYRRAGALLLHALEHAMDGSVFVPILPACKMGDLAEAMATHGWNAAGVRSGEKLHESLIAESECATVEVRIGAVRIHGNCSERIEKLTSDRAERLDVPAIKKMLAEAGWAA